MDGSLVGNTLDIIARILICSLFIYCALSGVRNWQGLSVKLREKHVPMPTLLLLLSCLLIFLASLSLLFGEFALLATIILMAYIILANGTLNPFWKMQGKEKRLHTLLFMSNLALIGALLLLM